MASVGQMHPSSGRASLEQAKPPVRNTTSAAEAICGWQDMGPSSRGFNADTDIRFWPKCEHQMALASSPGHPKKMPSSMIFVWTSEKPTNRSLLTWRVAICRFRRVLALR